MADVLSARRRERERLIELAAAYVDGVRQRLPVVAAAVVGSVARGDFNVWSDVDVVLVAERLPIRAPDRSGLLLEAAPAGVQPVGFTPDEFEAAWRARNPLVHEAVGLGATLAGEEFFARYEPRPTHSSPPS